MDYVFLIAILICGLYDFKTKIIPNKISIPLVLLCLLYHLYIGNIIFSFVGFVISFSIGTTCFLLRGMGGGDVKLMAALGSYLGTYSFFSVLFLASIISVIWGMTICVEKKITVNIMKNKEITVPFGTCLSIALVCVLL